MTYVPYAVRHGQPLAAFTAWSASLDRLTRDHEAHKTRIAETEARLDAVLGREV